MLVEEEELGLMSLVIWIWKILAIR